MSDREPRKRRKKKDNSKKDELGEEVSFLLKPTHQIEETSDSDGDGDGDADYDGTGVARCVFFVLFSLLVAASGIIYWSLQGAERPWEVHVATEPSAMTTEPYESILPSESADEVYENIPIEKMHPWAQHTQQQTIEVNFDSLYDESEYEDEAGFLGSTSKSNKDEIITGQVTENADTFQASIASIDENFPVKDDVQEQFRVVPEYKSDENKESEIGDLSVSTSIDDEIRLESIQLSLSSDETELYGEAQPSSSYSVAQVVLEASIASHSEETSQLEFTHILEDESLAKSTENVASPESVVRQASTIENEASRATTEGSQWGDGSTIVQNTAAPLNDEDEVVTQPEPSNDSPYENADVTNDYDFIFREELDEADQMIQKSPDKALKVFDSLLSRHPKSPRSKYGQARCLDRLAETRRNNALLEQAISAYTATLQQPKIPEALYLKAGERLANRMRFRGFVARALKLQIEMAEKFPGNANISNQLAVSYLMAGKGQEAKKILKQVLANHPTNGFAKVHYGFILKTEDNNHVDAIKYLSEGIASKESGVIDGRFFFHLGDALARTKQLDKAMQVYKQGVQEGVFLSVYQRSLYNVKGLTGKPWWKPEETRYYTYITLLEKNWAVILKEALALMDDKRSGFIPESEGLQDTGDWKQFEMFARGRKVEKNCLRAAKTCALLEKIPDASDCKRGQIKFSIMQPGTHIWAHTGPTNCRLRSHLGLVVPKGPRIRVANETKEWQEGKVLMFDDSFEHEVWHDGSSFRLILIVDFWHPELTAAQKKTLTPI